MITSKLPEWPEAPFTNSMAPSYTKDWADYNRAKADAALARMEALVEVVTLWRKRMRHSMDDDDLQAVDELLAACERKEDGQ